jgi:hypothetical protein
VWCKETKKLITQNEKRAGVDEMISWLDVISFYFYNHQPVDPFWLASLLRRITMACHHLSNTL